MSDPKTISPLLDGFKLGAPIREHNGIVCRPAIKENSNKKYIVKMITVPASQSQLDALLLAGAYKDPADAMEYFRRKGESILREAEHLKVLSKLEGFLPFEGWQMEPITRHRLGYEVYLVGTYKRSLEKYMAKNALTHLEAINLSLDLCSALSVCRQSGYIYVDLKPSNIYVSDKKEYRIGDLGFLSLDSLRYASLPDHYHSPYTPPELLDPMNPMNLSADTYAVGMILYQLYNDGQLPFKGAVPEQPVPNPIHADYELAEIIMKAISPNPDERWLDPKDLGKAIAGYMQRNSVNDIPITPFIPLDVEPEAVEPSSDKKRKHKKAKDAAEATETPSDDIESQAEVTVAINPEPETQEVPSEETPETTEAALPTETESEPANQEEKTDSPDAVVEEPVQNPEPVSEAPLVQEPEETVAQEDTADDTIALQQASEPEETLPAESQQEQEVQTLSEDVLKIINKADDLIAYEIPKEVLYTTEPEIDPFAFAHEDTEEIDVYTDTEPAMDEEPDEEPRKRKATRHYADKSKGKKVRKFLGGLFGVALTASACVGGYWYYQNLYLQPIDSMTVAGTQNQITVLIDTPVEESALLIHCTDTSGSRLTESVVGGKATFSNLDPSTEYTITAEISGFHKLSGNTTELFKTEAATRIVTFEAIAGPEAGSVILDFTVDGDEPDFWNIRYRAEGEDERRETVTDHRATISGLTVGKAYTFTLDGGNDFDLSGNKELQFVASKLILAENLTALSGEENEIVIRWKSPGDAVIDHWSVRCSDGYGYEEEYTVTDTQIQLNNLNPAENYTVEVTAAGMTAPATIKLTTDAVHVDSFHVEENQKTKLKVKWDFTGEAPKAGWLLMYTVDGSGSKIIECPKAEAVIEPLIPGATYNLKLETVVDTTVYNSTYTHTTVAADTFADNGMKPENLSFGLLKTPADENWTYETLADGAFTDTFAVGEPISVVISSKSTFYMSGHTTKVLYVIRNSYGNVLTDLVTEETHAWNTMWQKGDPNIGELSIPALPNTPGNYVLQLYFNGKSVAELDFQIT